MKDNKSEEKNVFGFVKEVMDLNCIQTEKKTVIHNLTPERTMLHMLLVQETGGSKASLNKDALHRMH